MVSTLTGTLAPALPLGETARTAVVDAQSSSAWTGVNDLAFTLPKNTASGQPRLPPPTVTWVPPAAGPEAGVTDPTRELPGGYRYSRSAFPVLLQPVTVHSCTSTSAGFWPT